MFEHQRWRWWLLHVGSGDATASFVQKVKRLAVGLFGLPLKGILWGWKGFWCHNEPPAATGWKDSSKPFPSSIGENKKWQQTSANAFHFLLIQEDAEQKLNKLPIKSDYQMNWVIFKLLRRHFEPFIHNPIEWTNNSICQHLICIMYRMHYLLHICMRNSDGSCQKRARNFLMCCALILSTV